MNLTAPCVIAVFALGLSACTNPYDPVQRGLGGGILGAASGAAIGAAAGGGAGAALGAANPRSVDTNNRERQLAVDFIAAAAGGPTIYLGRDMKLAHTGMGITKADYAAFMRCLSVALDTFEVPEPERSEVVAFTTSLESEIVEA